MRLVYVLPDCDKIFLQFFSIIFCYTDISNFASVPYFANAKFSKKSR